MTSLAELRFFTTPPHECSYLDGEEAITLFADPGATVDKSLYSKLSAIGFRRSGAHIYRPYCESCSACIPVRLPTSSYQMSRRQKRIWNKNQDIEISVVQPATTDEYFDLYERYVNARHSDGDMYPAARDQFESFLVDGRPEASFIEFRLAGKLLAIAVCDELDDGLSAIYTFFDPEESTRSLGGYAILKLIDVTRSRGLAYLYLGYWIKQCQKMSYKLEYKPTELFINNQWVPVLR